MFNLVWPVDPGPMAYPHMKIKPDEHSCYPWLLAIADSFYWLWFADAGSGSITVPCIRRIVNRRN